jgi:hypothetical protein
MTGCCATTQHLGTAGNKDLDNAVNAVSFGDTLGVTLQISRTGVKALVHAYGLMFFSGHTCPKDKQTCSQGPTVHLELFIPDFKPSTLLHESKQTREPQHVQRGTNCADALSENTLQC